MRTIVFCILCILCLPSYGQQTEQLPPSLHFIENRGQWQQNILYKADLNSSSIYLEKGCITFDLADENDLAQLHGHQKRSNAETAPHIIHKHCYKIFFEGADTNCMVEKNIQSRSYSNYFIGNDKSKWASKVFSFAEISYKNIYPDIDLKVYSRGTNFKYDFILHPGADPKNIKLRYEGPDRISLVNNKLTIEASFAQLQETPPVAYVQTEFYQLPVQCNYQLINNTVSFNLPQLYDKNYPLVIDPELIFASYTGSFQDNWGYTATYDLMGNLYGGGIVFGTGYPTTTGAYQVSFGGGDSGEYPYDFEPYDNGCDVAISKFSSDGSVLLYSTYLGGGSEEIPQSLIVDNGGNLLVYGTTGSGDFPTSSGAYDNSFNGGSGISLDDVINMPDGTDIYVVKLSEDGSDLLGGTFIGGSGNDGLNLASATQYNYGDFARGEIIVDAANNVYVATSTSSGNFPTTASAFQPDYNGSQDGVVFKLNAALSTLVWATYIGGSSADGAFSLKRNSAGEIIAGGGTSSTNFPVTAGSWHTTYQGGSADGWVVKLNSSGSTELAGTYVGTSSYDQVYFVEKDDEDDVYFTGQTMGSYFVTAGVYTEPNGRQFITKLTGDLGSVDYSMVFGSGSSAVNISICAMMVDECQDVYVAGWGGAVNNGYYPATGNTNGMTVTPDAIQSTTDGSDFYFFGIEKDAADIMFGSYFGGNGDEEHVDGGTSRFDKSGTIYQGVCAGCGGSDGFPTTSGAVSQINGSSNCNLGVAKINLGLPIVYATCTIEPSDIGCAPFEVSFENLSSDADEFVWNFGDGSPEVNTFEPTHTYTEYGTYEITLTSIDSSTCNIADSATIIIQVYNPDIVAEFDTAVIQNCDSLTVFFTNMSTVYDATEYTWDFGDGTTSTGVVSSHTYTEPGNYEILITLNDSTSCNKTVSLNLEIHYLIDFNTGYTATSDGCLPVTADFTATFNTGDAYTWDFGDGTTSEDQDPSHVYTEPGTYLVTLTITFCGFTDVYTEEYIVYELPTAYFNADPYYGIVNAPTTFINESENAASYLWDFGDGTFSTDLNASHIFTELGNQQVCLTAYNAAGCEDLYCREVSIQESGAAGVPTGFTPNGDGTNDILFVKGFGFARMDLKVFNRWGQLVFETNDQKTGWDGTYKGKPLDMDVFVYMLKVEFTDGKLFDKNGNVTLIR